MAHKSPLDRQARGRQCLTECQRVGDVLSTLYPSSSSYYFHTFPLRPIPRVPPYSVPHGLTLPPILLLAGDTTGVDRARVYIRVTTGVNRARVYIGVTPTYLVGLATGT